MLNLLATFFYGLAAIFGCISTSCDAIGDYYDADRTPEIDSKLRECEEARRFSRLLWGDDVDELATEQRDEKRANYEEKAAQERIRRTNLSRSPVSRIDEPRLVEAWVPEEVSS